MASSSVVLYFEYILFFSVFISIFSGQFSKKIICCGAFAINHAEVWIHA
jgi:hypothetical protein